MALFGRVHECKEYEHWNEKKNVSSEWNDVNSTEEKKDP